jgi:hypothetical protein
MRAGLTTMARFPREFTKAHAASPAWRVTGEICRDLATRAAQDGTPTLFVLVPATFQVDERALERYVKGVGLDLSQVDLDQPTRRLTEELGRQGLAVYDALPRLREEARRGTQLFGRADTHLWPDGHRVVAEELLPLAAEMIRTRAGAARTGATR